MLGGGALSRDLLVMLMFYRVSISVFFFFFKQKTAYELRISDWSSDVCSSDLSNRPRRQGAIRRSAALPARPALPAPEPRAPLGAPTAVRQRHRDATACPACRRAPACGTTRRRRRGTDRRG